MLATQPVVPQVRKPGFAFTGLPRRWLGGRLATHLVNAANLVFPAGEQFFCRSVRRYLDRVDPALRRRAAALIGQEARHGLEHARFFAELEAQGFELASWLARYERVAYGWIEPRTSGELDLATTAALEHLTASLALLVFEDGLLADADPRAERLLRWHAAEELEHRDVAFDVLQAVDPRYRTRAAGFFMAVLVLHGFVASGWWHLVRQEAALVGWPEVARELLRDLRDPGPRRSLRRLVPLALEFLRPSFHPEQLPGRAAAEAYLTGGAWRERAA